jgi:hypothetical protein
MASLTLHFRRHFLGWSTAEAAPRSSSGVSSELPLETPGAEAAEAAAAWRTAAQQLADLEASIPQTLVICTCFVQRILCQIVCMLARQHAADAHLALASRAQRLAAALWCSRRSCVPLRVPMGPSVTAVVPLGATWQLARPQPSGQRHRRARTALRLDSSISAARCGSGWLH